MIDSQTPDDGGAWYIDRFADQQDVDAGEAENTNTLYKLRMKIEDIVVSYLAPCAFSWTATDILRHANYTAHTSIRDDMDRVDIPYPTPGHFTQPTLFATGWDYINDRYLSPAWITATPDEIEESTDGDVLAQRRPRPNIAYRLKEEVARSNGLKCEWTIVGSEAQDVTLPDGTVMKFPQGSRSLQVKYDTEVSVPMYEKPEVSL